MFSFVKMFESENCDGRMKFCNIRATCAYIPFFLAMLHVVAIDDNQL